MGTITPRVHLGVPFAWSLLLPTSPLQPWWGDADFLGAEVSHILQTTGDT